MSKLKSTHHIEVEVKMDEMDLTAVKKKATYDESKAYVLEHTGLKVSNLYIAQVKQKCSISLKMLSSHNVRRRRKRRLWRR